MVLIILDSARYDLTKKARTPNLNRLGKLEKRYSYASWTSPSHYSLLMGQMPHCSPKMVFASETYQKDFAQWKTRTGAKALSFKDLLPEFSLPKTLQGLGYSTHARVSLPVLNPRTPFSRHFNSYKLMSKHNEFHIMLKDIKLERNHPKFYFLNLGETHYPYLIPGETLDQEIPSLHGLHGTLKHMGDSAKKRKKLAFFSLKQLRQMKERQLAAIEYVDKKIGELFETAPKNTHFIVTSDHGELFGEEGYFGHGPIFHPKVFEVPFVEGKVE